MDDIAALPWGYVTCMKQGTTRLGEEQKLSIQYAPDDP